MKSWKSTAIDRSSADKKPLAARIERHLRGWLGRAGLGPRGPHSMRPVRLRKGDRLWVRDDDLVWREAVLMGRASGGSEGDRSSSRSRSRSTASRSKTRSGSVGSRHSEGDDTDRLLVQLGSDWSREASVRSVSAKRDCEVRLVSSSAELAAVEDLTQVPALHEPSLLATLHERFKNDSIYTNAGRVLLAVNPYKQVKGAYGKSLVKQYYRAGAATEGLAPHLYAVASTAYVNVLEKNGVNQTVLVSGESGAGKTESTKILLRAVTQMAEFRLGSRSSKDGNSPRDRSSKKLKSTPEISDRVLQANPILEAFGNASTVRNENSSRFGKLIQVALKPVQGTLEGANITTYLLEKARLTHQGTGERNFHIFYAMAAGGSTEDIADWRLYDDGKGLESFSYISDSEAILDEVEVDRKRFGAVKGAMKVLGFTQEEIKSVLQVVAGVLHLGNIRFSGGARGEGARVASKGSSMLACAACCDLLELDADALERALCKRVIRVNASSSFSSKREHESFEKPLTVEEAESARDALAMTLYERLFAWLVWRINHNLREGCSSESPSGDSVSSFKSRRSQSPGSNRRLKSPARTPLDENGEEISGPVLRKNFEIGVLDVFGFEVFEQNGFEQLCINYCNERLQNLFNDYVFMRDQKEYNAEGINWDYVNFPENNSCLEMIESRPIGLLALLDENCLYPHGNDESLINKLYNHLPQQYDRFISASKKDRAHLRFAIRHFAGDVLYTATGFTRKNKNELRQEAVDLLRSSREPIVSMLCPSHAADAAGGAELADFFDQQLGEPSNGSTGKKLTSLSSLRGLNGRRKSKSGPQTLQQKTVIAHFKAQLDNALQTIEASEEHFVRCLKPNDDDEPGYMDRVRLVEQLRYSGVLQMVQVARGGYSTRMLFDEFLLRFCTLLPLVSTEQSPTANNGRVYFGTPARAYATIQRSPRKALQRFCKDLLRCFGFIYGDDFQTGKTKIFLRQHSFTLLELAKDAARGRAARTIQRNSRTFLAEQARKNAAIKIQCMVRARIARNTLRRTRVRKIWAARTIQVAVLKFLAAMRRDRRRQARQERSKQQRIAQELGLARSPIATRVTFDLANLEVRHIESRHDDVPYTAPSIIVPAQTEVESRRLDSPPPPTQAELTVNVDSFSIEGFAKEDAGKLQSHSSRTNGKQRRSRRGSFEPNEREPTLASENRGSFDEDEDEDEFEDSEFRKDDPYTGVPVETHKSNKKNRKNKNGGKNGATEEQLKDNKRSDDGKQNSNEIPPGVDESKELKDRVKHENNPESPRQGGKPSQSKGQKSNPGSDSVAGNPTKEAVESKLVNRKGKNNNNNKNTRPSESDSDDDLTTTSDDDFSVDSDSKTKDGISRKARRTSSPQARQFLTAFIVVVVVFPVVIGLGGLDLLITLSMLGLMGAWVWFQVVKPRNRKSADDSDSDDDSDDEDSSDDESGLSMSEDSGTDQLQAGKKMKKMKDDKGAKRPYPGRLRSTNSQVNGRKTKV